MKIFVPLASIDIIFDEVSLKKISFFRNQSFRLESHFDINFKDVSELENL